MRFILIVFLLFSSNLIFGQFQKIINQSIDIQQGQRLDVNLAGTVSFQEWVGSFILIETKVVVKNGNERIFKSWMKEKRYLANVEQVEDLIRLYSHPDLGRIEIINGKQVDETVFILIRYPKGLKDINGNNIVDTDPQSQIQASGG